MRPRGHAAYVEDPAPVGERVLDVSFLLRATGLHGSVRVLELLGADASTVVAVDVRRGQVRAGGRWRPLPLGPVRLLVRLRGGRATLAVNGRSGPSVAAPGAVDRLRLGAVHGGRGVLAFDRFLALRG